MVRPIMAGEPRPPKTRATKQGLRKLDEWLIKTASEHGSDWEKQLVAGMNPKNMSPADRSLCNQIIYDDPDGVTY